MTETECRENRLRERLFPLVMPFLLFFTAHAYRFTHLGYTDDSVEIFQNTNRQWQISLGRWLQVLYWRVRGAIVVPYTTGILSAIYFACALWLIIRLCGIRKKRWMICLCLLLSANGTITFSNATYISWTDVYMLSFLLSVSAVALWREYRFGCLAAAPAICLSLALYQSYVQVSVTLALILLIRDLKAKREIREICREGLTFLAALLQGLLLYAVSVHLVEARTGIARSMEYNGIGRAGGYTAAEIPSLLVKTWLGPFQYFLHPEAAHPEIACVLYGALFLIGIALLWKEAMEQQWPASRTACTVAALACIPLSANFVCFISHGLAHSLMIYSYFVGLTLPIMLIDQMERETASVKRIWIAPAAASGIIFFTNFIYANQVYAKRDLEFFSTLSVMTRVIDRVEQMEEYEPGYTEVAFVWTLYNSPLAMQRPGFERLSGNNKNMNTNVYATSGESFYPDYFWEIMGYPFNFVSEERRKSIASQEAVKQMPVFPERGSCQMIDDVMVVKIGKVKSDN